MTTPEIVESRVRRGTLTLDGVAFATQATNVRLEPSTDTQGDTLEVLSGDQLTPDEETTWSLVIVALQDFDEAAGFVAFALDRAGDLIPFVWSPNDVAGSVSFAGTARVRPVPIGGDVNSRLTTTATWPLEGAPTPTWAP